MNLIKIIIVLSKRLDQNSNINVNTELNDFILIISLRWAGKSVSVRCLLK